MHFPGSAFWLCTPWNHWPKATKHSWNIPRRLLAMDNGWSSLRSATFSRFVSWESICISGGDHPVGTRVLSLQTLSVIQEILCRVDNEHQWHQGFKTTNSEIKWPKKMWQRYFACSSLCNHVSSHPFSHGHCLWTSLHTPAAAVMDLLFQCFKCLSLLTTCTNSLGFVPLSHGSQISEAAQLWSLYAMNEPHTCKPQSMQACSIPQGKLSFCQKFIHCVTRH